MNKTYESYLLDNEEVVWEAKPIPFKLLDGTYKGSLLMSWIIAGLIVAAYLALYIPYAIENDLLSRNAIIVSVVIAACAACVLFRPLVDKRNLEKKTTFVLTDHRALVISRNNVRSMFIDADTPCKIEKLDNGAGAILMGTAVNGKMKNIRSNSLNGIPDNNDRSKCAGMIFYSVENAEKVCDRHTPFKR